MTLEGRGQWWNVITTTGSAASLHDRPIPEHSGRLVWAHSVTHTALVLGSTQTLDIADHAKTKRLGIEVCKRRSGGGAVLIRPEDTWIDLLIGADDPLWDDDVGRAFGWVGGVWQRALASLGVNDTTVHQGRLRQVEWGRSICFAGLGPGEVVADLDPGEVASDDRVGRKIVGLSQRRTRTTARFQTMVPFSTTLAETAELLVPTAVPKGLDPHAIKVGAALDRSVLTFAFLRELHRLP